MSEDNSCPLVQVLGCNFVQNTGKMWIFVVCQFCIGTLVSQKKRKNLFWEYIFSLLNLKKKISIEGQKVER